MNDPSNQQKEKEEVKKKVKEFTQSEKARKGWVFSVVFLGFVILMILFLAFVPINPDNRDIVVGVLGTITGSIGSMIAIAAGRDPAEIEELKEKLAVANADRQALISRLRDSQIQLQILRDQISDLQLAMITELSIFKDKEIIRRQTPDEVELHTDIKNWLPKENND